MVATGKTEGAWRRVGSSLPPSCGLHHHDLVSLSPAETLILAGLEVRCSPETQGERPGPRVGLLGDGRTEREWACQEGQRSRRRDMLWEGRSGFGLSPSLCCQSYPVLCYLLSKLSTTCPRAFPEPCITPYRLAASKAARPILRHLGFFIL